MKPNPGFITRVFRRIRAGSGTGIQLRKDRGVALIITLAAVVLLTVLLLAFFSRAQLNRQIAFSSSNSIRADMLARSAGEVVIGELRQEIADGSWLQDGGNVAWPLVYQPRTRLDASPRKTGVSSPDTLGVATLLKVSSPGVPLRPSGSISASEIRLGDRSANGRAYSFSRWFDSGGPQLGSQPLLPAWFYMTRNNGVAAPAVADAKNTTGDNYVVGRFACTLYETSGRLNANVAGYPSVAASLAGNKSSTVWLDLSKVSGSSFTYGGSGTIDPFMAWRNGPDAATKAAYAAYVDSYSSEHGFLDIKDTHNAFLSRKDLLKAAGGGVFPGQAKLFTHVSRYSQAPSWGPEANAPDMANYRAGGKPADYLDNANDADSANRYFPNVRHPANATVTHYKDDGSTETYTVKAGDSLVQRRFSLARLAWFTPSGPQSGKSAAIEACFGLRWDAAKWRWEYVAGKNPPGVRIKNLKEVADEGREPNFFEMLNAGILSGSLGQTPGEGMDKHGNYGVYASLFDHYKNETNMHVFQVGANIIDQYDADSYPTAVHFDPFGLTGADDLSLQTAYGIENLPYLHGLIPISIADPLPVVGSDGTITPGKLKAWVQPVLWNPHELPGAKLADYPAKLRGYAYGELFTMWKVTGGPSPKNFHNGPITRYDDGNGLAASAGHPGEVYFSDTGDLNSAFYNNPIPLTQDLLHRNGAAVVDQVLTPVENQFDPAKWSALGRDVQLGLLNKFAGFSLEPVPDFNPHPSLDTVSKYLLPNASMPAYFSLQYLGPDGTYHPYTFMARMGQSSQPDFKYLKPSPETTTMYNGLNNTVVGMTGNAGNGPSRVDPRTDRFSEANQQYLNQGYTSQPYSGKTFFYGNPQVNVNYLWAPQGSGAGSGVFGLPYVPNVFNYEPAYTPVAPSWGVNTGGLIGLWSYNDPNYSITLSGISRKTFYTDPDGIVRYGDAYRQNQTTGDGSQLYIGNIAVTPASTITSPGSGSALRRRAVVLNRPFRSVGELGFAHRDLPMKTLDLWSATSADAALLDLFSVSDLPAAAAGQININSASQEVLRALLVDTAKNETLNLKITDDEAGKLADMLSAQVAATPHGNRSELALLAGPAVSGRSASTATFNVDNSTYSEWANKSHAEAPMRALASVAETQTWNLLLDVVAQSGRLVPGAGSLRDFVVEGERRYWVHLSIDRTTGRILHRQWESVYE